MAIENYEFIDPVVHAVRWTGDNFDDIEKLLRWRQEPPMEPDMTGESLRVVRDGGRLGTLVDVGDWVWVWKGVGDIDTDSSFRLLFKKVGDDS